MYGKIFASMYQGSIYGKWEAIVTFQQMIVLADQDGVLDMTAPALSAITSIPIEIITKGISILESPDPDSRTPAEDGRRIIRLDPNRSWGWRITNYSKYRAIRTAEERREYHKQYWHKRKNQNSTDSTVTQQTQPIVEVEAKVEVKDQKRGRFTPPSLQEVTEYCKTINSKINPSNFIDFYESKGWVVGKTKMKSWQAAVRTWEQRQQTGDGNGQRDSRSRAKRVADKLDEIARKDINENGFVENLD